MSSEVETSLIVLQCAGAPGGRALPQSAL